MGSLLDCKSFQEELKVLLFDGSFLKKEDASLFGYISKLENPKGVLDHSKNFKDEGNSFFKEGDIDGALEMYGLACVFLSCVIFKDEEDNSSFLQLATSIVLNMAASLLKKREFRQVGHLCSMILNYNPNNVKALFRRACAAIGLGNKELACWDLRIAYDLEPSNREVLKKLCEVEKLHHEPSSKVGREKDKQNECCKAEPVSVPNVIEEFSSNEKRERSNHHDIDKWAKKTMMEVGNNDVEKNEGENRVSDLDYLMDKSKPTQVETTTMVRDKVVKTKESGCNPESVEPKYHFLNKKRSNSTLVISTREYHLLAKGKTIQHFNPRSGVAMSIRVIGSPKNTSSKSNDCQTPHTSHPLPIQQCEHANHNEFVDKITQDTENQGIFLMEISPPEPEEVIMDQVIGDAPTPPPFVAPINQSPTCFHSINTGNRSSTRRIKNRAWGKGLTNDRRVLRRYPINVLPNHVFQCRSKVEARNMHNDLLPSSSQILPSYRSGMKRKPTSLQSPDLPHQPRKLLIVNDKICNSCCTSLCNLPKQIIMGPRVQP